LKNTISPQIERSKGSWLPRIIIWNWKSDLQPAVIVAAIVAAMQDECTSMSYQGLPELRLWLIFMQKLWCNTQPCNRNFAFDGF
jgi:hypothetical protein